MIFILTLVAALCSVEATLQGTSAGFATDKGFSLAILNIATLDSYNKHDPQVDLKLAAAKEMPYAIEHHTELPTVP